MPRPYREGRERASTGARPYSRSREGGSTNLVGFGVACVVIARSPEGATRQSPREYGDEPAPALRFVIVIARNPEGATRQSPREIGKYFYLALRPLCATRLRGLLRRFEDSAPRNDNQGVRGMPRPYRTERLAPRNDNGAYKPSLPPPCSAKGL